jgi:hypothetical protein
MSLRKFILYLCISFSLMSPCALWAAHPLITDDAGTQGQGKFQLEINGQYDADRETEARVSVKSIGGKLGITLSYGALDRVDLVVGLPYQWSKAKENGTTVYNENGIGDVSFEFKWRFFEKDGLSLAIKPVFNFATGDEDKGLGTGKTGYQIFFIGSKEVGPWSFHLNVGYIANENKMDEEKHLWHASAAATYDIAKNLKLVGNAGIETNPVKGADKDPAFVLCGIIYSLSENLDIDCGVKYGLTKPETNWSFLAGLAFRF